MRIVVCIKQISDPEIPPCDFRVDQAANSVLRGDAALVINPFDENAVEIALQLKDSQKEATVTALNLAGEAGDKALRRALSMGCDEAVWLKDPLFEALDSFVAATVLARGIKKIGAAEIVLCGRQAGDWDMSQVGHLLSEELSIPCVSIVSQIGLRDGKAIVKREVETGMEILEIGMPFLATVTSASTNQPRYPTAKGILTVSRKKIHVWSAMDLEMTENISRRVTVEELTIPNCDRDIHMIDGEDGTEKAINLVRHLVDLKMI
jgi:electron transfer flavoprotein beta subunit